MPEPPWLSQQDIVVGLQVADAGELFDQIAIRAAQGDAALAERIRRRLTRRHEHSTVALGNGVALPHAAVPGLRQVRGLYLRTVRPIDLGADDGQPVADFLTLLVPFPAMGMDYDRLMDWSRKLMRVEVLAELREAADAPALHRVLTCFRLIPTSAPD